MATFKPITSEEIASSSCRVKVLGEPAEVWASWWNDCDSADTAKKYLFGVVEDDGKPGAIRSLSDSVACCELCSTTSEWNTDAFDQA